MVVSRFWVVMVEGWMDGIQGVGRGGMDGGVEGLDWHGGGMDGWYSRDVGVEGWMDGCVQDMSGHGGGCVKDLGGRASYVGWLGLGGNE